VLKSGTFEELQQRKYAEGYSPHCRFTSSKFRCRPEVLTVKPYRSFKHSNYDVTNWFARRYFIAINNVLVLPLTLKSGFKNLTSLAGVKYDLMITR